MPYARPAGEGIGGEGDRYFALELRSNEVERSEGCGMHQSLRRSSGNGFRYDSPSDERNIDSSDLKYIYENEDGSFDINLNGAYYGEVDYQMIYKDVKGDRFDWLYVDFPLLKSIAETCGLHGELVAEGEHYDYLARIFQA